MSDEYRVERTADGCYAVIGPDDKPVDRSNVRGIPIYPKYVSRTSATRAAGLLNAKRQDHLT